MGWEEETAECASGAAAERLGSKPLESIPNACSGWAETQAAYRFLSNPRTDWKAVLQAHWERACSACAAMR